MRTAHELLTTERRRWSDDGAAAFIRNCILRRSRHYKPAADAAWKPAPALAIVPPRELELATIENDTSKWATAVNHGAMDEISRRVDACFAGVPFHDGLPQFREGGGHYDY
ncbi:MAG: hypothetical protein WAK26_14360 [Terracidiphilus sp.]